MYLLLCSIRNTYNIPDKSGLILHVERHLCPPIAPPPAAESQNHEPHAKVNLVADLVGVDPPTRNPGYIKSVFCNKCTTARQFQKLDVAREPLLAAVTALFGCLVREEFRLIALWMCSGDLNSVSAFTFDPHY